MFIENPRHLKSSEEKLKKAQRNLSRKKKGSNNRKKAKEVLANAHERVAWKREDFLHQTSSGCGHIEKKQLSDRVHDCTKCALVLDRDVNAAIVILNFALTGLVTGREPALSVESKVTCSLKYETPSIPEHARESV